MVGGHLAAVMLQLGSSGFLLCEQVLPAWGCLWLGVGVKRCLRRGEWGAGVCVLDV